MYGETLPLSVLFGAVVGLSLGLTGGGGAIFAVPLLVYALGVPPQAAVGVSLAAVGATSLVGFLHRWRLGQVETPTGLLFAAAGMLGAPVGSWIASLLPDALLLLLFAVLMVIVAARLWQSAHQDGAREVSENDGPTCRRDAAGALALSSRCAVFLVVVGLLTGVLSGLFGVGGGFVIVPALILASGMPIQHAVGTSLMVIALVSVSGVTAHLWRGGDIPWPVLLPFVGGGVAGLFAGQSIGRHLAGPTLQRVFAITIVLVAAYILLRNPTL
jgi:hypothetical protein